MPVASQKRGVWSHALMLLAAVLLLDADVQRLRLAAQTHTRVPVLRYVEAVFWIAILVSACRGLWSDWLGYRAARRVV